jgi:Kef-type K+ transport system membrane component KefB
MTGINFTGLLLVAAIAFTVPLLLSLAPSVRLPSVVLELVAGIVIGPAGFGWVTLDEPLRVLSLLGLALLLFLSGIEIEFDRLRGRLLLLTAVGFAVSFGLAALAGFGLAAIGLARAPLLLAIILVATSLGVVVPTLKDARQLQTQLGQLIIAAASIADFGAVILLSILFSRETTSTMTRLVLLAGFVFVALALLVAFVRAERSALLSRALVRLQDTTAQIRVRGAFLLLIAFVALAERLGLEVILGAFMAGAILSLVDRDRMMTHPAFRSKLEAVGFGVFIPVFFVTSGIQFDLHAVIGSTSGLVRVPVFLAAILMVRGLPAIMYRPVLRPIEIGATALLQATTLPFIVAASMIGTELGVLDTATGSALIAAGLLSVLLFPLLALTLLRRVTERGAAETVHSVTNTEQEALRT